MFPCATKLNADTCQCIKCISPPPPWVCLLSLRERLKFTCGTWLGVGLKSVCTGDLDGKKRVYALDRKKQSEILPRHWALLDLVFLPKTKKASNNALSLGIKPYEAVSQRSIAMAALADEPIRNLHSWLTHPNDMAVLFY